MAKSALLLALLLHTTSLAAAPIVMEEAPRNDGGDQADASAAAPSAPLPLPGEAVPLDEEQGVALVAALCDLGVPRALAAALPPFAAAELVLEGRIETRLPGLGRPSLITAKVLAAMTLGAVKLLATHLDKALDAQRFEPGGGTKVARSTASLVAAATAHAFARADKDAATARAAATLAEAAAAATEAASEHERAAAGAS